MFEAKELNIPKRRSIIPDLNYTHYQKQTDIIKECHEKEAPHKWWPKQPKNVLWMDDKGQLCEG
jgi:hypothetical protein